MEKMKEKQREQHREMFKPCSNAGNNKLELNLSAQKKNDILDMPRSKTYMEAIAAIDLLGDCSEEQLNEIRQEMDEATFEEFTSMTKEELQEEINECIKAEALTEAQESTLIGIAAKCGIFGCDCHAQAEGDGFWVHYSRFGPILYLFAPARVLLKKHRKCQCIEVYTDCCRIIEKDSSVTKVPHSEIDCSKVNTVKSLEELDLEEIDYFL